MVIGKLHCEHKTIDDLDPELLSKIADIELRLGITLNANSGVRCPECNAGAGGDPRSSHLPIWQKFDKEIEGKYMLVSHALDVSCTDFSTRGKILELCYEIGIKRIGVYSTWLHLDNCPYKQEGMYLG